MERIKNQVDQLQQQLAGLSLSQKMLTVTLVAIMVATVVWWAHYAATDEMVALFDQPLAADEAGGVQSLLLSSGIEHEIQAGQVYVPADRRDQVVRMLAWEDRMPANSTSHLQKAIERMSSFDPRQKTDLLTKDGLQGDLADMVRGLPGVRSVSVTLNTVFKRQIGESLLPSAAVTIKTQGDADHRRIAEAASRILAASTPALKPENVTVIINGQTMDVLNADGIIASSSQHLRVQADAERHFTAKVREALGIPGLGVSVYVEINDEAVRRSVRTVDKDSVVTAAVRETTDAEDVSGGSAPDDPGMVANTNRPLSLTGPVASSTQTRESGEVENAVGWGGSQEEIYKEAGRPMPRSCSLSVPMSWVVQQWQARNRTSELPEPDVLKEFELAKLEEISRAVSVALGGLDTASVAVRVDADADFASGAPMMAGLVPSDEAAAGISALIRDYGKEVAVAALAAVSLLLVSTMIKKSAPLAPPPAPTFDGQPVTLYGSAADELAGIAGEAEGLLMGQEIDEASIHAGQVIEQVQTLVKENPDAAAALVRRWLTVG